MVGRSRKNLPAQYLSELTGFRAEAEGLLAVTRAELPANALRPNAEKRRGGRHNEVSAPASGINVPKAML